MDKEQLIWEYLDNPNAKTLAKEVISLSKKDPQFADQLDKMTRIHSDLNEYSLDNIDPHFSNSMQEKIINELSLQKNSSSTDFQFWGIVLCLLLTSIFILASMTTQEGNMNDWVSNWQLASPNLNEIRAPQITLPFEISWNIYIILVIPFVLYYMDWVIVNSSRLSRYTSVLA